MGTRIPTIYVLSKNKKSIKKNSENFHFYNFKNLCILHGQVFVVGLESQAISACETTDNLHTTLVNRN